MFIHKNNMLMLISLFLMLLTGCYSTKVATNEDHSVPEIERTTKTINYEIVDLNQIPDSLQKWIVANERSDTEKAKSFAIDGDIYVVIILDHEEAHNYKVDITNINHKISIKNGKESDPSTTVTYELIALDNVANSSHHIAIAQIAEQTSDHVQFTRLLTDEEFYDMNESDTNDANSPRENASSVNVGIGGGTAHIVPVEQLTDDGKIKQ